MDNLLAGKLTEEDFNNVGELSGQQLKMVNDLQLKVIKEEDRMSSRLASVQENIADNPITLAAKKACDVGESSEEVDEALSKYETAIAGFIEAADNFRLQTLKELLEILTPSQGLDFLASSKKLHLCIREWGKKLDDKVGRKCDA